MVTMTYYLHDERVRDIRERYGVALRVVDAAEYRTVFELPSPEDWGGDMTHAEWLDGFSTIDYPVPAGPQTYESWLLGPTVMYPEIDPLAEEIYQEIVAGAPADLAALHRMSLDTRHALMRSLPLAYVALYPETEAVVIAMVRDALTERN